MLVQLRFGLDAGRQKSRISMHHTRDRSDGQSAEQIAVVVVVVEAGLSDRC